MEAMEAMEAGAMEAMVAGEAMEVGEDTKSSLITRQSPFVAHLIAQFFCLFLLFLFNEKSDIFFVVKIFFSEFFFEY